MDTFEELQQHMADFVEDRDWNSFHNPKNLVMSIAIEAAELMEIFQWVTPEESRDKTHHDTRIRQAVNDEVADIIIYILSLANTCNLDLKKAVLKKMNTNQSRFPVGTSL